MDDGRRIGPASMERRSYVAALTDAIEAWSAHAVRQDASAFRWRNADLRYAVERQVYFELINDKALQSWFEAGAPAYEASGLSGAHGNAATIAPFFGATAEPGSGAAEAWRALRRRWTEWRRPVPSHPDPVPETPVQIARATRHAAVLFLVLQPKFVRFLLPVARRLAPDAAFLTVDDPSTEAALAAEGLPAINLRLDPGERAQPKGLLEAFATLCSNYDRLWRFIDGWSPRAMIVPEGNSPVGEAAIRAAQRCRVPTLCIQHGWSPVSHPGFRNMSFDRMLVWGRWFAEQLAPGNPKLRFAVTGDPALPSLPFGTRADRRVRAIGFFLQKGGPLISDADWRGFLDLLAWTAARFPDVEIVVRDHPSTPSLDAAERARVGNHPNLRFVPPTSHRLSEVISACDIVVAAYSTTLLEALAVGAIPLVFGASRLPQYCPDLATAGAAIEAKTFADARAGLDALIANARLRATLRQAGAALRPRLFDATGERAVSAIADEIARAAGERRRMMRDGACR